MVITNVCWNRIYFDKVITALKLEWKISGYETVKFSWACLTILKSHLVDSFRVRYPSRQNVIHTLYSCLDSTYFDSILMDFSCNLMSTDNKQTCCSFWLKNKEVPLKIKIQMDRMLIFYVHGTHHLTRKIPKICNLTILLHVL